MEPTSGFTKPTWATVVGRKAKKKATPKKPSVQPAKKASKASSSQGSKMPKKPTSKAKVRPGRPPKTAVITVTSTSNGPSYAEIMMRARTNISLPDLGISEVRPKRAVTGGLILAIPGEGREEQAAKLTERMRVLFANKAVKIVKPAKTSELRIRGLDDSISPGEVVDAIVAETGCVAADVKTGVIRHTSRGMGSLWLQCPLTAARRLATAGRLRIGWVMAAVDSLPKRALQCYRCLEMGHVRSKCPNEEDRSGLCYRCG